MRTYVMCLLAAGLWSTGGNFESNALAQETAGAAPSKSANLEPKSAVDAVQKLKGSWTIVAGVNQGHAVAADSLKGSRVVFGDETIVVFDAELKELYKASYKLSGARSPFQIRMTNELPNREGDASAWIDRISRFGTEAVLRLARWNSPDQDRISGREQAHVV